MENVEAIVTATIGTFAIAVAIVGCLNRPLPWPHRAAALGGGVLLLFQGLVTGLVGLIILVALFAIDRLRQSNSLQP